MIICVKSENGKKTLYNMQFCTSIVDVANIYTKHDLSVQSIV